MDKLSATVEVSLSATKKPAVYQNLVMQHKIIIRKYLTKNLILLQLAYIETVWLFKN
ncbi:hypothetical protein BN1221_04416 [Brenneria goodwinii]|uniref:Uncharacterized protein n=1 Tax=Brenneria goodwinii TaxID=1109412 RepID=A0A0G4K116_9GAMM|nr:hypothetical protein BN1221_04416 [Brenneria goodwinii]